MKKVTSLIKQDYIIDIYDNIIHGKAYVMKTNMSLIDMNIIWDIVYFIETTDENNEWPL